MGRSNNSGDLRALLESKNTLSSMPSVDEPIVKNGIQDAEASEIAIVGQSDESASNMYITASNSSSINSVSLNFSAVTVHCNEEEEQQ
jgi:hypothetical protein